jgi:hypothetical protein
MEDVFKSGTRSLVASAEQSPEALKCLLAILFDASGRLYVAEFEARTACANSLICLLAYATGVVEYCYVSSKEIPS